MTAHHGGNIDITPSYQALTVWRCGASSRGEPQGVGSDTDRVGWGGVEWAALDDGLHFMAP